MEYVNQDVVTEYRRWINKCAEENIVFEKCVVSIADVLEVHFSIVDSFYDERNGKKSIGGVGPRDLNLLSSAVARQATSFDGIHKWQDNYEKAATLFFGLIKNHPFHDCNKRTAMLSVLYYLEKINRTPKIRHKDLETIAIRVAESQLTKYRRFKNYSRQDDGEIYFLANFFRRNTRTIDKRYYIITYNQLNALLSKFNYKLINPHKNLIDIIKIEKKRKLFGLGEKYTHKTKVGTIGFPGWTREVPRKEIKSLRHLTGLTHRDGFDSGVFYRDAEPLKSLINEYGGLLRRLSKK
jgi:death-on-curing protein